MPGLYRLYCDSCTYEIKDGASITIVLVDDGTEKICPHPLERRAAEEATGMQWRELEKANRIRYRFAYACLNCGHKDFYELGGSLRDGVRHDHIYSITYQPTVADANGQACISCGHKELYPICGEGSIISDIKNFVGIKKQPVLCPICKTGALHSEMFAIS